MSSGSLPLNAPGSDCGRSRSLPHRLRLLCIGAGEPPWSLLALRLDAAGCHEAEFDWQSFSSEALAALRKKSFDAIIILEAASQSQADTPTLSLVEAVRASGTDDPIVVILTQPDDDRIVQFDEFDCEVLVSAHRWHSRALVVTLRRSLSRGEIRRDIGALDRAVRQGRVRERDEAAAQLRHLRMLVADPPSSESEEPADNRSSGAAARRPVFAKIDRYYGELLRAYVMMGSGNLNRELRQLAEILSLAGTSTIEALSLHLEQVESLFDGLGSRSSRHVMARADLLAIELMIQLGECYRRKSRVRGLGDSGIDLLHAETLLQRNSDETHG